YALDGFKPALEEISANNKSGADLIPALMPIIADARPELAAMRLSLDRIAAARSQINNLEEQPYRLRTLIELMDNWLPLAQSGLKLAPHAPQILGADNPRYYLIIAQNEDELRSTGGFISGAGLVIVENGRIADLSFLDANLVDNWLEKPYDIPPQPLYEYMRLDMFLFRDANFWPDFPTSAEKAMELYRYGQDTPPLDGVIAVDQRFLQLLVEAVEPVSIPDSELTITSDNVIENLQAAWSIQEDQATRDWILGRKAFIGDFAAAIQTKLESDPSGIDPVLLAENMLQAIETKHLQIYLRDPALAAILSELGWDGRLPNAPQRDFLMIVDSNMGYNKTNIYINREIAYQVHVQEDGSAQANVTVNYQHSGEDTGEPCTQGSVYTAETTSSYQNLVNRCYWNYLRIYAPPGSQLLESSQHTIPAHNLISEQTWDSPAKTVDDLAGLTTFANFMLVPRGQPLSSHFAYQLPARVIQSANGQNQYRLAIFKQAGTRSQPVKIAITLPEQAILDEAFPAPTNIEGATLYFEFGLEKDTFIVVNYH
ncbi:MAG: DUF4012 domain-containing protein, partial [Chloroflexi bacterium]|nr:DUF4012 domain-containing protein [Chloroflexota bacterium]